MTIRQASPADAATISRLNVPVQQLHADAEPDTFKQPESDAFAAESLREWLAAEDRYFYIAHEGETAVGYIYGEVRRRPENPYTHARAQLYIHQIAVAPAYQGRGYGAQLIRRVRDLADELGIETIALDTWVFNDQARQFFAGQGFTPFMVRMRLQR
jgi:GNAT superfamily N-acetyltransferase